MGYYKPLRYINGSNRLEWLQGN
ncbi:hypothetical protein OF001_U340003 [Pseudomonas sp. OF001]|nr:hypothetical protein OF001_U340003 [Pseudomonas sp. OF001]